LLAESGSARAALTMERIVPRNLAGSLPTGHTRLFFFPRGAGADAVRQLLAGNQISNFVLRSSEFSPRIIFPVSCHPLADIGRAIPELDAVRFAAYKKTDDVLIH
jgi:hypothetical protein